MDKIEIKEELRAINSMKSKKEEDEICKRVDAFMKRLIEENGDKETADIREELLINLLNFSKRRRNKIPVRLHKYVLEVAKIQEDKGKFAEAKETLEKIIDKDYVSTVNVWSERGKGREGYAEIFQNSSFSKAAYRYTILRYKLKEIDFAATLDILNKIIENSDLNKRELLEKLSSFELFKQECSEIVGFDQLEKTIFPKIDTVQPTGDGEGHRGGKTEYSQDLSALKRLKFIKQNFKVAKIYMGKEEFSGYLLFELEDADLVIAERFWTETKEGVKGSEENATFILPKEESIDLIKLAKSRVRALAKEDSRIQAVNHSSSRNKAADMVEFSSPYYNNLKSKFNTAIGYEYFKDVKKPKRIKAKTTHIRKEEDDGQAERKNKIVERPADVLEVDYDSMSKADLIKFMREQQKELEDATKKLIQAINNKKETQEFEKEVMRISELLGKSTSKLSERLEER